MLRDCNSMSAETNKEQPAEVTTGPSASLHSLAEVAEEVAATTKKLAKVALVGDYLKQLDDADLSRAARYFAGHQFPLNDARTTNVGGSIISVALSEATGFSPEDLYPRYVRLGGRGVID